ncbi:DUF72 domain-containing protein [Pedobacter sp. Du54]|uniref:DUF72 domain-containing protein n=1 Tax=Pedobacter anseongensis TaxID=3133439 RepID=UPI003095B20B
MEFGRVEPSEIKEIDFSLPKDGHQTAITFKSLKATQKREFYVGCAKWGRKEWVGLIYPPKTKEKDFLGAYVKHFNSIELNAVFYNIPKEEQILKWKEMTEANTSKNFIFCPKFSRSITHIKRLNNADVETDLYLKAMSAFGKHLGPCFLQVSDNFGPKNLAVLEAYLQKLPKDLKVFVEVRHQDWFKDPIAKKELFEMLAKVGKGAAITDASGRRDCLHMELPTPEAFIRFVGNGGKFLDSDKARVDEWVIRIKQWLNQGLQKVYFFLHQHDEADTPLIADYTIEQFNAHFNSNLSRIEFIIPNKLPF